MNNVIAFPAREPPPVTDNAVPQPEPPSFLDWVYLEVVDFQHYAGELATIAEQDGEDAFWSMVEKVKDQINGWSRRGQQ